MQDHSPEMLRPSGLRGNSIPTNAKRLGQAPSRSVRPRPGSRLARNLDSPDRERDLDGMPP